MHRQNGGDRLEAETTRLDFDAERFRPAPNYDFTRPPHAGQLFYEKFNWGMTGEQWRALAGRALQRLDKGLDFRRFREDFFLQL